MKIRRIFVFTFLCTLFIAEKSTAMKVEMFVIKPDDERSNTITEENSETDTSAMEIKDKKPISGDENIVIKPDDERSNTITEENSETDTSDMERKDKKSISGDENIVIQPDEKGFNVISEKIPETEFSDMQRKGKNKKPSSVRNCLDLKKQGKGSGTYLITPCDDTPSKVVNVYCDMDTDGGGWTVIQRRDNYPQQEDFNNTWYKYAVGFGDPSRDFWLGNDNIHCLTEQINNKIRFDLQDWAGYTRFASYSFFYIDDRSNKYKLHIQNYDGTAGDSFSYHTNMSFSTLDADYDATTSRHCAVLYTGGWWFNDCRRTNPNGLYNVTGKEGLIWYHWKGWTYTLKKTEMKIRPNN